MAEERVQSRLAAVIGAFAVPLIIACSVSGPAVSQDVVIFNQDSKLPSAQELGNILFPEGGGEIREQTKPKRVYRGIRSVRPRRPAKANKVARQIGLAVKFEFNSIAIHPASLLHLDQMGKMLKLQRLAGKSIIIEGHTDAKGSNAYNLRLSKRRAEEVKRYFVGQHGIEASRLITVGKGESEPLLRRNPEHPSNRRVQFRRAF